MICSWTRSSWFVLVSLSIIADLGCEATKLLFWYVILHFSHHSHLIRSSLLLLMISWQLSSFLSCINSSSCTLLIFSMSVMLTAGSCSVLFIMSVWPLSSRHSFSSTTQQRERERRKVICSRDPSSFFRFDAAREESKIFAEEKTKQDDEGDSLRSSLRLRVYWCTESLWFAHSALWHSREQ